MVPSSNCKAGGSVVIADANVTTPVLLRLPFAFAVVPMDGLGQVHRTFFDRTASLLMIVAVVHDEYAGVGQ